MFDLVHASSNLKKAARLQGFRSGRHNAWFKPVTGSEIRAIVGNNHRPDIEITIFDVEYAAQFTWSEIRSGKA